MNLPSLFVSCVMVLALSSTANAQALITGADAAAILNAARGYGAATLTTQENGDPQINGKINGIAYQVYFQNCIDNANCEDLNFYVGFLDLKPTLEVINDWNFKQRFSRAYLDSDKDACVEMDIDLVAGVSPEYLDDQFGIWNLIVVQFSEHVGYK